ncbi:MAG: glycosyltransferase family 2 protein [Bdellovibrionales bacterium]|nr:glycosyltransferase family 2 protein [Bdellovibrionales bacterium]
MHLDTTRVADIVSAGDEASALRYLQELLQTQGTKAIPYLSIIAPVYDEDESLREFVDRLLSVLKSLECSFEIILVDDGSGSSTKSLLADFVKDSPAIIIIELSRNFGHQSAITAGLQYARGTHTVIMDSDLQDPPELIPDFLMKAQEGAEVVYGIRKTRQESAFKKFCYYLFYRILKLLSSLEIPLDAGDFCLMSRSAVDSLNQLPERSRFVRGLRSWVGFRQIGIPYDRDVRFGGKPKYTIRRLVKLALDGLIAFGYRPLRAISCLGLGVSVTAFLLAIFYILQKVQLGLNPPGFASTMVAIFFFSGIQLVTLGILGEYVGRIYEETKQRPSFVVRRVIRH